MYQNTLCLKQFPLCVNLQAQHMTKKVLQRLKKS